MLEDTRNRTLHGILRVQSCFRGHQARCYLKELRRGITTLQSCIDFLLIYLVIHMIYLHKEQTGLFDILFQLLCSVVRGEKMRKEYAVLLQRHRAAVFIQKLMKSRIARQKFKNICDASIVIQSGILSPVPKPPET